MSEEEKKVCNHEFNCTEKHEISDNCIVVTLECKHCKTKFQGVVYKK